MTASTYMPNTKFNRLVSETTKHEDSWWTYM